MRDTFPPDQAERPDGAAVALAGDPRPDPDPCGATVAFDYSVLAAADAERVQQAAICIRRAQRDLAQQIGQIGRHLNAVKEALLHGAFTAWAEAELGMSARSAQRYMQAAAFLDGKPDTLSLLPPTLIYSLAAPSAPKAVVKEVVDAAEQGAPLPPVEIEKRLGEARAEAREAKEAGTARKKAAAKARARARKKGLSQEEAEAHAAKLQEREEQAVERRRREAEEQEARLRAVVAAVAPLCRPHATALIDAIRENQQRFAGLLADALAEAEAEA